MFHPRRIAISSDHPIADPLPLADASDETITLTIAEGLAALEDRAAPDVAIVDIYSCSDEAIALIAAIDTLAEAGRLGAIVIFTPNCIDAVSAAVTSPNVQLLCDPSAAERMAAIGFAVSGGAGRVRASGDLSPPGLQSLAEEVARIARALASLAGEAPPAANDVFSDGLIGYRAEPALQSASTLAVSAGEVRAMIRARRLRDRYLPPELFGEPAWDMLLDLFAARIERTKVAVSSLCIAAAVPPTTALRTIRAMTDQGLFARIADPADKRRVFIELTEASAAAMQSYVAAARAL